MGCGTSTPPGPPPHGSIDLQVDDSALVTHSTCKSEGVRAARELQRAFGYNAEMVSVASTAAWCGDAGASTAERRWGPWTDASGESVVALLCCVNRSVSSLARLPDGVLRHIAGWVRVPRAARTSRLGAAARAGQVRELELLVALGAPLDATGEDGSTALMEAATAGSLACVRLLLEAGANVHVHNNCGRSALRCATVAGHAEIAEYLAIFSADLG